MDDYESVQKGGLKLKGVSTHSGKKKKKSDKEKKKIEERLAVTNKEEKEASITRPTKTKAELAFERAKKKKSAQQILERASKSHKERIMDFNQQLDNLTEHFDIPKVSWTK
ncbi:protein FAM32A [Biomphalaria glabrata]|uniref:Protein FAM32A-like n=1 Tax=Biomphalaria glabrata TaxID=6526 RepID=A0A2C9LK87_BIOGL|nr:protein FAM32A-like [Biomphalaria glabrata]XP_055886879.1 protein FAM32A-like [Biomphalaria glabrata]KAI8749610.1 protein FAM32A-like [Biomphalaria glabrata]KAI8786860.1 protein FAM32A [Biomphalaria glabrata]